MERDAAVDSIRNDNTSGSQTITRHAAALAVERVDEACRQQAAAPRGTAGSGEIAALLLELGNALIDAHPAMAPLYNLFGALLECVQDGDTGGAGTAGRDDIPGRVRRAAAAFVERMDAHNRAIGRRFGAIVEPGTAIFTHSASSTVRAALLSCRDAGRRFTVHCTESRPVGEGSALARELAGRGIAATLSTDSLAFALLRRSERAMLVVGADAVTPHGVVNKAGTLGLAAAAGSWGVPFYVLAGSEKFLPSASPDRHLRERPPEEILAEIPEGLRVVNRYFDLTPLDCVTAIITEEGRLTAEGAIRKLAQCRVHPGLTEGNSNLAPPPSC
ncbi:MAG: hypothetical protein OXU42_16140 [Deltaproteobacteria bacterium]|nr:hypothetical protein [Deltaproteobacteria bacterium]